jgi:hypothetical protein
VGEQGLHSKSWQQQRHHKSEAQSKQNDPTFKSSAARLETAPCLEIQFSRMQGVLFTKQISQVSLYKMVKIRISNPHTLLIESSFQKYL